MINEYGENQKDDSNQNEAEISQKIDHLKDIALKGLTPLLNVVQKHKGYLNLYFEAFDKAIKAGVNCLNRENSSDIERKVGTWFSESSSWVRNFKKKIDSTNTDDLFDSIKEEASKRPAFIFAISYVAGMAFGRIGRHLSHKTSELKNIGSTIH